MLVSKTYKVDGKLHEEAKLIARNKGTTLSTLQAKWVQQYVDRNTKNKAIAKQGF